MMVGKVQSLESVIAILGRRLMTIGTGYSGKKKPQNRGYRWGLNTFRKKEKVYLYY